MASPRQVYTHKLDAIKGYYEMYAVDYQAPLSSNVTFAPVFAGRVVHLNSIQQFEMGCVGDEMPMYLLKNSDNPDVGAGNPGGSPVNTTTGGWVPIFPSGVMNALVAVGAYELESTEFDPAQTYLTNQPLRAQALNSDSVNGGLLTNQGVVKAESSTPQSATAIVGIVSRPPYQRQSDRPNMIGFWPIYKPGAVGL